MRPFGQLGGLAALIIALAIGAGAILLRLPAPPKALPQPTPIEQAAAVEHMGVGAACSRTWEPIAALAARVRDPIVNPAEPPVETANGNTHRPLTPLNWRFVNLYTLTRPDGTTVQAAVVRVDGIQRVLTVGDKVPAPGPDDVEILDITPERLKIKRGEVESEIQRDDDMKLTEERGFGV